MPIQPLTHWLRLPDKGRWWSSVTRTASMGLVVACVLQIVGCASEGATAEVPRRKVVGLACGTPLPSDCAPRVRTYSTLPSTNNCSTCDSAPEGGDPSPGAQLGRQLSRQRSKFEQAAQVLERAARGEFGDNAFYRQMAEYTLARVLVSLGDEAGATDLAILMVNRPDHQNFDRAGQLLMWRVPACPTFHALSTLKRLKNPPDQEWADRDPVYYKALMYKARGLAEIGEYDEARALFKEFGPQVTDPPAFVAQCVEWLEGRSNQRTAVPVGRPCNCDIEPPQWREGCGCEPRQPFVAPEASEPEPLPPPGECLCAPSGQCSRRTPYLDLNDGTLQWTKEPCNRKLGP
jgi:hypothetical protein